MPDLSMYLDDTDHDLATYCNPQATPLQRAIAYACLECRYPMLAMWVARWGVVE